MHDHVESWAAPEYFTRFSWDVEATLGREARWGNWRHAPGLTAADEAIVERAAAEVGGRLTEFGSDTDRFGLIHADLRMANLMIDPDKGAASITVIDFDDCGWSWYLFDLAAVVSFIEDTPEAERMIADWLRGYLEVRDISAEHLEMIPTLVMLRRLHVDGLGCVARRRRRRDRLHGRLRDGNCPAGRAVSHRPRLAARRHPLVVIFVDTRMSP